MSVPKYGDTYLHERNNSVVSYCGVNFLTVCCRTEGTVETSNYFQSYVVLKRGLLPQGITLLEVVQEKALE